MRTSLTRHHVGQQKQITKNTLCSLTTLWWCVTTITFCSDKLSTWLESPHVALHAHNEILALRFQALVSVWTSVLRNCSILRWLSPMAEVPHRGQGGHDRGMPVRRQCCTCLEVSGITVKGSGSAPGHQWHRPLTSGGAQACRRMDALAPQQDISSGTAHIPTSC